MSTLSNIISTLNVNGVSAIMRMRMLAEIHIILFQAATHNDFVMIRGYNTYTNVGINKRGTTVLTRETINFTNITRLPSGWGMAAFCRNIYMRCLAHPIDRRENIFTIWNSIVAVTAPNNDHRVDFNCVLRNNDCTRNTNFSQAIEKIIRDSV